MKTENCITFLPCTKKRKRKKKKVEFFLEELTLGLNFETVAHTPAVTSTKGPRSSWVGGEREVDVQKKSPMSNIKGVLLKMFFLVMSFDFARKSI